MTLAPVDVEATVRSALLSLGVPVSTKVPNPRPAAFIRISRAGGLRANLVQEQPSVIVECWSDDSVQAFGLAASAWSAMESAFGPELDATSPVWFPDPDSTQARYQFTASPLVNLEES